MAGSEKGELRLGLDLGPNSVGWALLRVTAESGGEIVSAGVRVFKAGLDEPEQNGKRKSRNVARREARGRRRMLERTARRLVKLAHILQRAGLLPEGDVADSQKRHELLTQLDKELRQSPYALRSRALSEKLTPLELGRALYHLAQRRGYKSNRLETPENNEEDEKGKAKGRRKKKNDEEKKQGKVEGGISELRKKMAEAGSETLGQYFAQLDPRLKGQRIRKRYTARAMYESEFDRIWAAQAEFHPHLKTRQLRKQVRDAIYHQRPLKSVARFIGRCELFPERRRAPLALLISQRFRYLQTINNLEVIDHSTGEVRPLTKEERGKLIAELETKPEVTFKKLPKLLGLGKGVSFNLERGGETRILGNKTAARLGSIFGEERWQQLTLAHQDQVVEDVRSIVKNEALARRGKKHWKLDKDQAKRFGEIRLEGGRCSFSKEALTVLVPELEKGTRLSTILRDKRSVHEGEPVQLLPPFCDAGLTQLRNTIVERTLTELRRVVNLIVRKYGCPDAIHIELARDLRQNAKQREEATKRMRHNESERKKVIGQLKEIGIVQPSQRDILKALLHKECNKCCPYTGRPINFKSLFDSASEFDIEHIIPFDRCLDNSFVNLTLCDVDYNRNVKRDRTPYETEGHNAGNWEAILQRVRGFQGSATREKLRRFTLHGKGLEEEIARFSSRQLNDTRWASKLAKQYVGLLYGGVNDDGVKDGKRRVVASSGGVTSYLRGQWGLNRILSHDDRKSRDDHRHHAIDAIVIALTDAGMVKQLNDAAKRAAVGQRHRLFDDLPQPWEGFHRQVEEKIAGIVTSHRVDKRVRGQLHKDTFYGKQEGTEYVHIRCQLSKIEKEKDIEDIIDPVVRAVVREHLAKNGGDFKAAFASDDNCPVMRVTRYPVHRLRLRRHLETKEIGKGPRVRHVVLGNNHHMEIVAVLDASGREKKWEGHVVSMYDAYGRKKQGLPVVKRDHGEGRRFLFSLAGGEIIELDSDGKRELFVTRTVPQSEQLYFVPINDARPHKEVGRKGLTGYPETIRRRNCRKMIVTPLGEVVHL